MAEEHAEMIVSEELIRLSNDLIRNVWGNPDTDDSRKREKAWWAHYMKNIHS